jgi:hypothetical protein
LDRKARAEATMKLRAEADRLAVLSKKLNDFEALMNTRQYVHHLFINAYDRVTEFLPVPAPICVNV